MTYLLDTSVLVRYANVNDAQHLTAIDALRGLHRRGATLCLTPQVLIEFRGVATRPAAVNGLGLSPDASEVLGTQFEAAFGLLADTSEVFAQWKSVVTSIGVIGKQVHDARLVAVCLAHEVDHLLTFDVSHFVRLCRGTGVTAVDPASV